MERIGLKPGEVWVRTLWADEVAVAQGTAVLNADELARAARMRVGLAREEFVAGRGLLRRLLGSVLGKAPKDVVIRVGEYGKPYVEGGPEFNVAHSGGLVVVAVSLDVPVGVDVERVDRAVEALDVAEGSFAKAEIRQVQAAAEGSERLGVFYRLWAKKEAVVKAHGQGLTVGLDSFGVDASANDESAVRLGKKTYSVREIEVGEGFVGALACGAGGMVVLRK